MQKPVFTAQPSRCGKLVEIRFATPRILEFEQGKAMSVVSDSHVRGIVRMLMEMKMPAEAGPYADNIDGTLAKAAWEMKKAAGRGGVGAEVKWLVEVLMPRAIMDEEGSMRPLQVPDAISYAPLECVFSAHPATCRESDEIMNAGRLTAQRRINVMGTGYILTLFPDEVSIIGIGVLRAAARMAFSAKLIRHDGAAIEGIVVFPNDSTMITFSIDRTHPPTLGVDVLDDMAVMSLLAVHSAENRLKRDLLSEPAVGDVNETVRLIRERAELAACYWPENPSIPRFLRMLENIEEQRKGMATVEKTVDAITELAAGITAAGGIKHLFGKGMPEAEVIRAVKSIIDGIADSRGNVDREEFHRTIATLGMFLQITLPQFGLSKRALFTLTGYGVEKFGGIVPA